MTTALDTPVRLLPAAPEDLRAHLARYGPAPYRNQSGALIADVEASGLTGRGGAAFPVHRKLAAVAGPACARAARWSWPTARKASRPAARTNSCCNSRRTSCSTACS